MANTVRGGKNYCIMKKIKERKTPRIVTLTVQSESFTTQDQRKEGLTKSKTARNVEIVVGSEEFQYSTCFKFIKSRKMRNSTCISFRGR